jgi:galactose oxidase-like protein
VRRAFVYLAVFVAALAIAPLSAWNSNRPDWLLARTASGPPARDAHSMAYDTKRGRVVLFAGANEYNFFDFADTWEWDGTAWTERSTTTSPGPRYGHALAYDAARSRVLLFGGYDFYSGLPLADTWEWDGNAWVETAPATSPPGRFGHAMAYDSARRRVVLFGGVGDSGRLADTWEWDGNNWLERTPAASPPSREFGALTYDGARARAMLFGGFDGVSYLADTWEWDGDAWVERVTATHPPGRTWHMLAFDEGRGRAVLFGGYDGGSALDDTWEWDGSAWIETTPAVSPSPRVVAAMVFDRARSRAVLFGGYDGRSPLADTWEWDGSGWVERTPTTSPPRRSNHAAAYDVGRRKTVIFGGYAGGAFLADTWEWDGSEWVQKTPATSPPSRIFHAMAYDRARARVVLFGGFGQRGPLADTWEWDGSSWVKRTPATSPPARHGHTMAYDAARGRVVLFGGSNGFDLLADTWEWEGSNWVEVTPATGPASRFRHAMTYDAARSRVVLFGGCGDLVCPSSDTWEWDGSSWVERTPVTSPPARLEHAMAYDVGRERAVLFGGSDGFLFAGDTWEWDGSDWTEATATSSPSARFHYTMTYDGVSGRVLLFGGFDATYLADTWEYGPIAACGNASRVIAFAPGGGSASATAVPALGPPDGTTVALGIGGRVDLGLDGAVRNGAGTDLIVHATAAASFRVEAGDDGDHYVALRDCPGGECQLDLSEAGLAGASYLRITSLSPDLGAEIDAVSEIHASPLAIACPASVRVECQAAGQAVVSAPPATATASCSGTASIVNDHNAGGADASGAYSLGTTVVTFTATDGAGNVASCSTSITVADTTPPVVTVQATPEFLWPPDHTMRPVHFTVLVVDACDPSPVRLLQSVASNEPDDAPGKSDGATTGDVQGAAAGTPDVDVLLRAERDGRGPGRTYSARYRSTDASGNVGMAGGTVTVPHDLRHLPAPGGPSAHTAARTESSH